MRPTVTILAFLLVAAICQSAAADGVAIQPSNTPETARDYYIVTINRLLDLRWCEICTDRAGRAKALLQEWRESFIEYNYSIEDYDNINAAVDDIIRNAPYAVYDDQDTLNRSVSKGIKLKYIELVENQHKLTKKSFDMLKGKIIKSGR